MLNMSSQYFSFSFFALLIPFDSIHFFFVFMLAPLPIETFLWCFVRRLILKQFRFRRAKELLMLSRKVASDDNKKKGSQLTRRLTAFCDLFISAGWSFTMLDFCFIAKHDEIINENNMNHKSEVVRVRREISGKIRKQFSSSFSTLDQASRLIQSVRGGKKTSQRALFTVSQTNWALISWF